MAHDTLEIIRFLALPFCMCLILIGIHCYLGLHVLVRGVIFVDLSLAQVAAFGTTIAFLLGFEHDAHQTYFISLAFTFVAAALFALARRYERAFSQEAVIGVVYAFGSAAVILVVDKMAHGAEHIKALLVGEVLWVSAADVIKTAFIYAVVGSAHFIFRKQFIAASKGSLAKGKQPFWDFIFYALFGVVITSSVRIAGVLQVFAYLIVPAIVATLFYQTWRARLVFGWIFGFLLSFLAMALSYWADLPSGACIVVVFTLVPIVLLLVFGAFGRLRKVH